MKGLLSQALCLALCIAHVRSVNTKLKELYAWKAVDYAWNKPEDRAAAVESGEFIPNNNLPLGLDVWNDKLFITVPRWKKGVVSTLNYVKIDDVQNGEAGEPTSPALIPYPSFEANRLGAGDKKDDAEERLTSVFRVRADACDRLWVMDTGVADILGETVVASKPRILIYNLKNDSLIRTYDFNDSKESSFYANIVVDADASDCDKAFAYVPDLGAYAVVVYDFANDKSWRLTHNYFHFDPLAGNMNVGGVNFQWTDGVFSIALSKLMEDGTKTAFFHPLASTKEFKVSTNVLKGGPASKYGYYDYHLIGDRGNDSQSSASFIHEDTGVMFYTQLQKDGVYCWNTNKDLTLDNLVEVASDNETMIFTNDLKVDPRGRLWVLTDKLPAFIYRGLDDGEVNYRIFKGDVDKIIADTRCAP